MESRPQDGSVPREVESTTELVKRARGGDSAALDRLFARYLPGLRRWASGRIPRGARGLVDTDDLVQDAMLKTFRNLDHFEPRGPGALGAYLRQSLKRRIIDLARQAKRRPPADSLPENAADDRESPIRDLLGAEQFERYERSLATLSEIDQAAIFLRFEVALEYRQIAAELGKPSPDAARMTVSRALVRLAEAMERDEN